MQGNCLVRSSLPTVHLCYHWRAYSDILVTDYRMECNTFILSFFSGDDEVGWLYISYNYSHRHHERRLYYYGQGHPRPHSLPRDLLHSGWVYAVLSKLCSSLVTLHVWCAPIILFVYVNIIANPDC